MTVTRYPALAGLFCALGLLGACREAPKPAAAPPTPEVVVRTLQAQTVPLRTELPGRTAPFMTAEVRPQVGGIIRKQPFTEGTQVKAGQVLYEIDPASFQAALSQQEGALANAQASVNSTRALAERYKSLLAHNGVSKQEVDNAQAAFGQAQAQVRMQAAQLETARINLQHTRVTAPISGHTSRSAVTPGALVSASQATPLATIQQIDPIYVDMQQSSTDLTRMRQALDSGGVAPGSTSVRMRLEDGSAYGFTGTVQFSEMTVNEATGTVTLRARFPNPKGLLLPGMFVTALFDQVVDPAAILVPQAAVQRDFDGSAFVYIVGQGNKAARRKVVTDRSAGPAWVVTDGLKPGDRVITQGLGNVRQDAPIQPVPADSAQPVGVPGAQKQAK